MCICALRGGLGGTVARRVPLVGLAVGFLVAFFVFSQSRRKGTEGPRFVSTDASSRCRSWVWRVIMMTLRGHFMSSGIPLPPCGHEWAETTEWCRVRCPQVAPPAATTTEATEHRADAPHMGPRMGKEQLSLIHI